MDDNGSENERTPLTDHPGANSQVTSKDCLQTYDVGGANDPTNVHQTVIDQQQRIKELERALRTVKKFVDQTSTKHSHEMSKILEGTTSRIGTETRGLTYMREQDRQKLNDDELPPPMSNFQSFKNEKGEIPRYGNKFSKKKNLTIGTITIGTTFHSVFLMKQLLSDGKQKCKFYWIIVILLSLSICIQLAALVISGYHSKKSAKDPKQLEKAYEHSHVLMFLGALVTLLNIVIGTLTYVI